MNEGMKTGRRGFLTAAATGAAAISLPAFAKSWNGQETLPTWNRPATVAPDESIQIWGDGQISVPAGLTEETVQRSTDPLASDRISQYITRPRLDIFRPDKPNGSAVIIAPGGGYRYCVVDKEGYELARLLSARGVTVYVLFYRLPDDGWTNGSDVPLADAQRAIRLVRSRAATDRIDPARVTMMGFSAGGHVAASLFTRHDAKVYPARDAVDSIGARPDAVAPIYPVVSMDPAITHAGSRERLIGDDASDETEKLYSPERQMRAGLPPLFLLHAEDDDVVPVENSVRLRTAAIAHNIPCETHLYEKGGHGFGLMKTAGMPVAMWPGIFWTWMVSHSLV